VSAEPALAAPTMRAYVLRRYRPNGARIEQVQRPVPEAGEVLVRVRASGLNPVDSKICDGAMRPLGLHRLPLILGNELSGTIASHGSGAHRFETGTRVCLRAPVDTMGGFADYIAVQETLLSRVPDTVDDETAAALPLAGLTAWQALHGLGHVRPGHKVFINAGAGGVGTLAIQLAKLAGAQVATAASPAGADLVASLGADEVINYRDDDPGDVLTGCDIALDLLGGDHTATAMRTLKPGGRLVSLSGPPEPSTRFGPRGAGPLLKPLLALNVRRTRALARRHQVEYRYLFMRPDAGELDHLLALAADRRIAVPIARTAPASRLDDLLADLRAGHTKGKLAVTWTNAASG
jgi:alcohol dehydrogenase